MMQSSHCIRYYLPRDLFSTKAIYIHNDISCNIESIIFSFTFFKIMFFKLYLRLIVFLLFYLFDEAAKLHVSADKESKKSYKSKDKISSSTQDKVPIPDLNFPPPNEKEEVKSNDKKGRETYTERMERYEKMGILEEYRIAQRRRRSEWQDKLSAEQKKEKSRKDAEVRKTKIAQVRINLLFYTEFYEG